jgi:trimethylamine--corrinoid protein Co-methyltransferase
MPGWGALHLDMRTMVQAYTGPDHQGVALALAHHFGLPAFAAGGMSEAKVVDQQAGIEAALTLLMNAVVGGHLVHDVGYLESGLAGSLAQLVICNEALAWVKRATQPLEVSAESLAVETVDQVGPDGQFLDSEHTLQHFQEHWYPELFERDNYEGWLAAGAKTLAERAGERVDEILAAHRPSALPDQVTRTLRAIVARAEAQAAG